MASKSAYQSQEKGAEVEELLDALESLVERLRVMHEQYFLGIARTPPSHLTTEAERKLRDLTQMQLRNTGLRYRLATISQKFAAYSSYWKRTMRQIEQGRYIRDLSRLQRAADRGGGDIPDEILATMPKLMRDRVLRDRATAAAIAERKARQGGGADAEAAPARTRGPQRLDATVGGGDGGGDGGVDGGGDGDMADLLASLAREAEEAVDRVEAGGRRRAARDTELTAPPGAEAPPGAAGHPPASRPPPPPAAARPPAPRPEVRAPTRAELAPPPGMSDAETRALYNSYLAARRQVGEDVTGVTYDKLLRTLQAQSTRIMGEHRAKGVEFGVVVKDNKVILKAKPKP